MFDTWQIAILGIIQGLTEYLPISSSGHLAILPKIMNWQDPGLMVDAFLHIGTLLAVLIYFRKEILEMLTSKKDLLLAILVATIPAAAIGIGLKDQLAGSELIRSLPFISSTLIIGAVLLAFADKSGKKLKSISDLSFWSIFLIGLAQALALMPGVSRSGITITAALLLGLNRPEAARFAFLIGIPAITGAGIISTTEIIQSNITFDCNTYTALAVGLATSFAAGLFAIDFLIKLLEKHSLNLFVIYRIILGILLLLI